MKPNYWIDLFTGATWEEFQKAGSSVSGFRESRWKTLQKVSIGDYFFCYLTGVSRFVGILEVTSDPFKSYEHDIWKDEDFPCRFEVKPVVELTPETAIPVKNLSDQLSFFQNQKSPHGWTGHFRSSPAKWKESDGEAVLQALLEAKESRADILSPGSINRTLRISGKTGDAGHRAPPRLKGEKILRCEESIGGD